MSVLIYVENNLHQFRHASELTREAKGGYIKGNVKFPGIQPGIRKIIIKLVKNPRGEIHPNVLHVTSNERKEKTPKGKSDGKLMTADDHQVELLFENGRVYVAHTYFQTGRMDVTSCWDAENQILLLDNAKLQLTVVKPKQRKTTDADDDLFLKQVVSKKMAACSLIAVRESEVDAIVKEFSATRGGDANRLASLFKVHLSVTCFTSQGYPITGVSESPIFDKGKYEVKFKKSIPYSICDNGSHEIMVIPEGNKALGDIPMLFSLQHKDGNFETLLETVERNGSHCQIDIPPNHQLPLGEFKICITIKDPVTEICISDQYFPLRVYAHIEDCPLCQPVEPVGSKRRSDDNMMTMATPKRPMISNNSQNLQGILTEQLINLPMSELTNSPADTPDTIFLSSPGSTSGYNSNSPVEIPKPPEDVKPKFDTLDPFADDDFMATYKADPINEFPLSPGALEDLDNILLGLGSKDSAQEASIRSLALAQPITPQGASLPPPKLAATPSQLMHTKDLMLSSTAPRVAMARARVAASDASDASAASPFAIRPPERMMLNYCSATFRSGNDKNVVPSTSEPKRLEQTQRVRQPFSTMNPRVSPEPLYPKIPTAEEEEAEDFSMEEIPVAYISSFSARSYNPPIQKKKKMPFSIFAKRGALSGAAYLKSNLWSEDVKIQPESPLPVLEGDLSKELITEAAFNLTEEVSGDLLKDSASADHSDLERSKKSDSKKVQPSDNSKEQLSESDSADSDYRVMPEIESSIVNDSTMSDSKASNRSNKVDAKMVTRRSLIIDDNSEEQLDGSSNSENEDSSDRTEPLGEILGKRTETLSLTNYSRVKRQVRRPEVALEGSENVYAESKVSYRSVPDLFDYLCNLPWGIISAFASGCIFAVGFTYIQNLS